MSNRKSTALDRALLGRHLKRSGYSELKIIPQWHSAYLKPLIDGITLGVLITRIAKDYSNDWFVELGVRLDTVEEEFADFEVARARGQRDGWPAFRRLTFSNVVYEPARLSMDTSGLGEPPARAADTRNILETIDGFDARISADPATYLEQAKDALRNATFPAWSGWSQTQSLIKSLILLRQLGQLNSATIESLVVKYREDSRSVPVDEDIGLYLRFGEEQHGWCERSEPQRLTLK